MLICRRLGHVHLHCRYKVFVLRCLVFFQFEFVNIKHWLRWLVLDRVIRHCMDVLGYWYLTS